MSWRTRHKGLWLARVVVYAVALSGMWTWLGMLSHLPAAPLPRVWAAEADPQREAEETRRAMEVFLREQRVLFRRGDIAFELNTLYSTATRDEFIRVDGDAAFVKLRSRAAISVFITRYGLLDGLELDVDIPFGYAEQEIDLGATRSKSDDFGLGDIAARLRYQLWYETLVRPDVILDLEVKSRTGGDTLLGTGHWHVGGGVTLVKTLDPVVFFGRLGYAAALERRGRDPGDEFSYLLGMGFSLNERVSFNMRVSGAVIGRLEVDGREVPGSSLDIMNLQFFVTTRATRRLFVEPVVSLGLTEDAPDVVAGVNLVFQFRGL